MIRTLSIVTGQRAIRDGRTLDVDRATLLAEAALAHPNNPVLARLGERAAMYLAQHQRPVGRVAGRELVDVAGTTHDRDQPLIGHEARPVDRRLGEGDGHVHIIGRQG